MPENDTTRVGPIIVSHDLPRRQLQQQGELVTFRSGQRTTGETWWRESRHGPKQGDCDVEEIGPADPTDDEVLREHRPRSGFETVDDWRDAIEALHGSLEPGYLYRVTIDERWLECESCGAYGPEVELTGDWRGRVPDVALCADCRDEAADRGAGVRTDGGASSDGVERIELDEGQRDRFEEIRDECSDGHLPDPTDGQIMKALMDTWDAVAEGFYDESSDHDLRADGGQTTDGMAKSLPALVGREWRVRIAYTVDYEMTVTAGPHRDDAIEEADLRRIADDVEPFDREIVHTEVEALSDIYEHDPEACDLVSWIDAPSAPSEETFWDDSRHFEEVDCDA